MRILHDCQFGSNNVSCIIYDIFNLIFYFLHLFSNACLISSALFGFTS